MARKKTTRTKKSRGPDRGSYVGTRYCSAENGWDTVNQEEERIPRYPSKTGEKRPLRVRIDSWVGTSAIGAKHYYADVQEGPQQWWCEADNVWLEFDTYGANQGIHMRAAVLDEATAIRVALAFVKAAFPDLSQHHISWDGPGCPSEWCYD